MHPQVIYVLKSAGICGGVRVVLEHIARLIARGYKVKLFYIMDPPDWFRCHIPSQIFSSVNELIAALKQETGIKIATWFETAFWVKAALNPDDQGYYLIQDIEESYCVLPEHKKWALESYKLGLKPISESLWVQGQLLERFGLDAPMISLGIDFDTFKPIPGTQRDRFRVLACSRAWCAGPNLKDWPTAKAAVERAFEQDRSISLVTFSVEDQQQCRPDMPHIHIKSPSDEWVNRLYNESGLFLLSSQHEGFSLLAAEAMATNTPVISTYADGNEEFCHHSKSCLMSDKGDHETLARHILYIFHNPDFANLLARQGHEYIKRYTWDRTINALEKVLFNADKLMIEIPDRPKIAMPGKDTHNCEYPNVIFKSHKANSKTIANIIIPTINDFAKIKKCVESINNTVDRKKVAVIVVDDGTKNKELITKLKELAVTLDFKLIQNIQNLGFSAAANNGMLNTSSGHIVLVNNDITFLPNWLDHMLECLADPKIGIVGAKLLYPDNTIQHGGVIKRPNVLHIDHISRHAARDDIEACTSKDVWAVTGAAFLIRREMAEVLGGLSTAYATAHEDVDYCFNAWMNGWKVHYCAKAEAYHLEGATRGATNEQKLAKPLIWLMREEAGQAYYIRKWRAVTHLTNPQELM